MKITAVETILLKIPFDDGGRGEGLTPTPWRDIDILLVRIDTDQGLSGWGEGFGYFVASATKDIVDRMIAPLLVGREVGDPATVTDELQRRLALFGRFGITMFAISGVDIALWDLAAKASGRSLGEHMGGVRRKKVPAYASLVRYGDAAIATRFTEKAAALGYPAIKLHEITMLEIEACRKAARGVDLIVDVNCAWHAEDAAAYLPKLADMQVKWLEEPIFPPEDWDALAQLAGPVALAAGENLCTASQFRGLIERGAVTFPQPSVTKVGGITEYLRVALMAEAAGQTLMPHSPYFGPGYHATLQLLAHAATPGVFEHLFVFPEALPDPRTPLPVEGQVQVPDGLGLGFEPDPGILRTYRIA